MKAFRGDPQIKKKYLSRIHAHAAADEIIKGQYWENGKGCAVGCTIHSSDHSSYETELGIPRIVARLEDLIFEGLPLHLAKTWPKRFLACIRVGADLSMIWNQFASRLLTDPIGGVIQYATTEEQREVIQRVSDLYEARIEGLEVDRKDFDAAYADAYADAAAAYAADAADAAYADAAATSASAATSAAAAAYADATYVDAAYAATYAAAAATSASADAPYAAATREKAYIWQSELLLELLRKA